MPFPPTQGRQARRKEQEMGGAVVVAPDADEEQALLSLKPLRPPPADAFHLAYLVYFVLGAGFLVPWNTFITAVDYFTYVYPSVPVDRVFSVSYMCVCLFSLILVIGWAHRSSAYARINSGLLFFAVCLLIPPFLDAVYIKGMRGMYLGFDVTVVATAIAGMADALVQSGIIGSAGELPEIYMQAVCSGTAASGVLTSILRIITKAVYPQDADGLRKSANLYFAVSIAVIVICIICYNLGDRIPIVQYYKEVKNRAVKNERDESGSLSASAWRWTLLEIFGSIKWFGLGIFLVYVVTLSIFPGFITEDVHSDILKDWYPIILITCYNVFDLVGKALPALYALKNENVAVWASVARLLFFPAFLGCLHGPEFLRTEIPIIFLTSLLGLTNGYLTSILLMLAPKTVPIQKAEMAGIAIVLFLALGLVAGAVVTWFWVI